MRKTTTFMKNWLFTDLDGSQTRLDLPHTWNALDGQDGGGDYRRGTCTYETEVAAPAFDKENEVVYLQFHGVNATANVVLNGKEVIKQHDGGYSTFRVEVTDLVKDTNKIVVKVDNSKNDRVYPQMADFTFYGGIYRDVEWLVVNKDHFDLDYCGSKGLKITPEVKGSKAEVRVETFTKAKDVGFS